MYQIMVFAKLLKFVYVVKDTVRLIMQAQILSLHIYNIL